MNTESSSMPTARDWATKIGIKAYRYRTLVQRRWWILAVAVGLGLLCESWILISRPVLYESVGKLVISGGLTGDSGLHVAETDQDTVYQTLMNILQEQS